MTDEAAAAAAAREEYLERLRRRISRPAETAARIRQGLPPEPEETPVLHQTAPAPAVAAAPAPLPASPAGARQAPAAGRWSLWSLEQLARRVSAHDPARAQELSYTLVYLRHHADVDGRLPATFSGLVERVFALPAAQQ